MRTVKYLWLLLPPLLFSAACSHRALSVFFDLPPPSEEKSLAAAEKQPSPEPTIAAETPVTTAAKETDRPAIETILVWEEFAKQLPKDRTTGQADWMAALREGIIKPRTAIDGPGHNAPAFKFDFFFPGPAPMFDAYFPHSSHTQWLACDSCHPKIFRTPGTKITMADIKGGKYCGVCHGRVAFGLDQCARCHVAMAP
jgi:c(7)-type cytochrome triheme protein